MKTLLTVFLLIFATSPVTLAQQARAFAVNGIVFNEDKTPARGVDIVVKNQNNTVRLKTDYYGKFNARIQKGSYDLQVLLCDTLFQTFTINVTKSKKNYNFVLNTNSYQSVSCHEPETTTLETKTKTTKKILKTKRNN